MDEARRILSFHVAPMKDAGYLVDFNKAVAVYVSQEEFRSRQVEIERRIGDLVFAGEKFEMAANADMGHGLIGVYARRKLHRDASLRLLQARLVSPPPQQSNKTKLLHTRIAGLCIVHLIQIYRKLTIPADRPAFGNGLSEEGPEYARAFGFSDQHEGRRGQIHDDGLAR